jgi:hypothetical protein
VAEVRQAVGEGRSVVEDELVLAVGAGRAVGDRAPEDVDLAPAREHALLDLGEARLLGDVGIATARRARGRAGRRGGCVGLGLGLLARRPRAADERVRV